MLTLTLHCAQAKAWSRFFCLSVYVTMYLNDHSRSSFYESLGLDTTQFNRCGAPFSRPRESTTRWPSCRERPPTALRHGLPAPQAPPRGALLHSRQPHLLLLGAACET